LRARAGLHVGAVILRENESADIARGAKPIEVEGLAKPVAARVMSIAGGCQTLLTAAAREDLGKSQFRLQSHGHWMVKGVADPLELFQVGEPEARLQAPAENDKAFRVVRAGDWWMPVREVPNNLPQQGTSFVGRERELDEIRSQLGGARLLTLLGTGGLGKTRLSLEVAADVMHEYPDGVWFIDLAPIRDPALVASEAAQTLGVREEPDRPLIQTLCAHLKSQHVLLIFDNCEHLIKPAAAIAHAIVKATPHVHLLATSRQALRVPSERVYPILPLPLPKMGDGLRALLGSPAVQLFVDRAQAHKQSFELNEREAPAVAALVMRLEGIPLALELAAARVRSLSVIAGISFWNFYFRFHAGAIRGPQFVEFLHALTKQIRGKLLVIWDGLPARRRRAVKDYVESLDGHLVPERLPAYAPELNPVEYIWGYMKQRELANLCLHTIGEVGTFARNRLKSMQRRPRLITAFWQQAELPI